mmetsp:Transcript_3349/g.10377  ORF Transcript_3349/g.10377 Transcript_3349/m.10377 type:complete len:241 (+) Transcript_3349:46-768(+)
MAPQRMFSRRASPKTPKTPKDEAESRQEIEAGEKKGPRLSRSLSRRSSAPAGAPPMPLAHPSEEEAGEVEPLELLEDQPAEQADGEQADDERRSEASPEATSAAEAESEVGSPAETTEPLAGVTLGHQPKTAARQSSSSVDFGLDDDDDEDDDDASMADEASVKVWSAYQRWRVTKIRLNGIPQHQDDRETEDSIFSNLFSTFLGTVNEDDVSPTSTRPDRDDQTQRKTRPEQREPREGL